jgi:glycosyltransferase involved in cell wall biosynthesis
MKYYIIIPVHNEEAFIGLTLQSIINQSVLPSKVVIVNDNSTDKTAEIVLAFAKDNPFITLVNKTAIHLPGSKVIQAFHKGFETLDIDYDIIVKLDGDLILPNHYFETILTIFKNDDKVGMAGGFAYIEKNGDWILENLTDKDHIRGAFKAYRKKCFQDIGNLKPAMGWDTVDELLAKFYNWKVVTDQSLKVKHLKPTGTNYNKPLVTNKGKLFIP